MQAPSSVQFAQVLGRLLEQRYKRNRAALASAAHVSPSALSQYVRGRATPSLAVLVDLARALEVSLDYLVYGQDSSEGSENVLWAQYLDDTVRRMTSEGASLRQLIDRMGANISDRIHEVATEVVKQAGARGGALSTSELAQVEQYSYHTRIATVDLDYDVLLPKETSPDTVAEPGPFARIAVANVSAGHDYVYVIPDGAQWIRRARLVVQRARAAIEDQVGPSMSDTAVADHLQFYVTGSGLVPGYVIYNLDCARMATEKPLLYDLIEGFLGVENETDKSNRDSSNFLALVARPNFGFDVFPLISRESLPMVVKSFENLRMHSDRLSFT